MRNPLGVLDTARRKVIDIYVEPGLVAEGRILSAYELSEQRAHDITDRAHVEMNELRLGKLHRRVEASILSGLIRFDRDRVTDVSSRHKEAF